MLACGVTVIAAYLPRRDAGYHGEKDGKVEHACRRGWGHGLRHSHICGCGFRFRLPDEREARRKMLAGRQGGSRPRMVLPPLVARVLSRPGRGGT
jgi:hypothetical protein